MSHIKDRLKQYADKYSDCYKYAGVYVKVIQDMIEQLQEDLEQDEKENGWISVSERLPDGATADILCACLKTIWKMHLFFSSIMNRSGLDSIQISMIQLL